MDLGARIKELRNERKLSQEAVAAALQVSRQAVAKWEANAASPSTANLMALCQLFQVSLTSVTQPPAPPVEQRRSHFIRRRYIVAGGKDHRLLPVVLFAVGGLLLAGAFFAWLVSPERGMPETVIGYRDAVTDIVITGKPLSCYLLGTALLTLVVASLSLWWGKKQTRRNDGKKEGRS